MARRKRRKLVKPPRKTIPAVLQCPVCGKRSISIEITKGKGERIATISCGSCGVSDSFDLLPIHEPIDAYCAFVDKLWK